MSKPILIPPKINTKSRAELPGFDGPDSKLVLETDVFKPRSITLKIGDKSVEVRPQQLIDAVRALTFH